MRYVIPLQKHVALCLYLTFLHFCNTMSRIAVVFGQVMQYLMQYIRIKAAYDLVARKTLFGIENVARPMSTEVKKIHLRHKRRFYQKCAYGLYLT